MRKETLINGIHYLKDYGLIETIKHTKYHMEFMKSKKETLYKYNMRDILFINGCPIKYCERYRVIHKMQELQAYGLTVDEVTPEQLNEDIIKYYRGFVIYRTAWDTNMDRFVKLAHQNNKVVFYDIDDLVFDLKFTKDIKELKTFTKDQLDLYNDGVKRYGKMLDCCDYSITTTKIIADEMKKHVKDVCIDKNIASLQMQKYSNLALKKVIRDENKVVIGYASGSITHNDDFELINKQLMALLDKYPNVYLKLIGVLAIPEELSKYGDRIITSPFVDYTKLPEVIRSLDINLAPLEDNYFNAAKSSIKWMEAGLVKVPTVASDVGNFHDCITNGYDGVLCKDNEWFDALEKLILDREYRISIGENAHKTVYKSFTPNTSGKTVADFIKSKLNPNICFVLPAANISGGIIVATKHAIILKKNGYDVTMINLDKNTKQVNKLYDGSDFVNVVSSLKSSIESSIDQLVATMWFTVYWAMSYKGCNDVRYLVQNREDGFYEPDTNEILDANATYFHLDGVKYLTISKWCQNWLKSDFDTDSLYAPNGIDLNMFPYKERKFKGKIKILIEGDSKSYYKNVDEAFKITNKLDKAKFEISYLSYNGVAKEWYKFDKQFNKIPHEEVYKIYQECDILLKTSILESFSYPPLEMMATGGLNVVVPNGGNVEFLKDKENCLMYEQGNIDDAIEKIKLIVSDKKLRDKLIKNGLVTAKSREWKKIEKEILNLYK